MQHQKLARIDNSDDPFAVPEPEKKKPRQAKAKSKSKLSRPVLIGAAAGGFMIVLLGVIFVFKNDKGEEVARVKLPDGGSVEARQETPAAPVVTATAVPASTPKPLVAPFDAKQAHAGQAAWAKHLGTQVETTNSVGMRLTLIPPGEFLMGSTPEQSAVGRKMAEDDKMPPTDTYFGRLAEEMPQHKVTISQPFLMGSTEVTVAQFRKFVEARKYITEAEKYGFGNSDGKIIGKAKETDKGRNWKNPGYEITDDRAVTQITWNDTVAYCAWLRTRTATPLVSARRERELALCSPR